MQAAAVLSKDMLKVTEHTAKLAGLDLEQRFSSFFHSFNQSEVEGERGPSTCRRGYIEDTLRQLGLETSTQEFSHRALNLTAGNEYVRFFFPFSLSLFAHLNPVVHELDSSRQEHLWDF